MPPIAADDVDPLVDFLARYDEGADEAVRVDPGFAPAAVEEEVRFLSFDLAGESYAASIMDIREILKVAALTEVPRAPVDILGVLSKRGLVMPVVDLAATIGLRTADQAQNGEQRILVVGDGDRVCGLRVDRVREVVRLGRQHVEDVPPSLGARQAQMLSGLGRAGDRVLILLDVTAVLADLASKVGAI
jgi:purine-binding chemotaxis protein CheW